MAVSCIYLCNKKYRLVDSINFSLHKYRNILFCHFNQLLFFVSISKFHQQGILLSDCSNISPVHPTSHSSHCSCLHLINATSWHFSEIRVLEQVIIISFIQPLHSVGKWLLPQHVVFGQLDRQILHTKDTYDTRGELIVFSGPNTNTNTIRFQKFGRIQVRILFGVPLLSKYEYE